MRFSLCASNGVAHDSLQERERERENTLMCIIALQYRSISELCVLFIIIMNSSSSRTVLVVY